MSLQATVVRANARMALVLSAPPPVANAPAPPRRRPRWPLRRPLQPLPNSPPSYRGVSEAVSPPHVRARPSHTLLTLFLLRSRIYFPFGRAAPRRWPERLRVTGAALS
eukprot:scaffold11300_cov66-Phaeocystis_antarctica.AAC.2